MYQHLKKHWDFWLFTVILIFINFPLFIGGNTNNFAFYPYTPTKDQWWRILTFVFAHLTIFHFFIDVIPFLVLYFILNEQNPLWRIFYFFSAYLGNTLALLWFIPIGISSIRGLSGITDGIITITALELIFNQRKDKI